MLLILLLVLPSVFAINLQVETLSSNVVMIPELSKQVSFDLEIKNLAGANYFEFYNLLGFQMFPVGTFYIGQGQTKNVELKISPLGDFEQRGAYVFSYFIQDQNKTSVGESVSFKVVELEDVFEVGAEEMNLENNSLHVYIHNKVNYDFEKVDVRFSSDFCDFEDSISLAPNKRKDFYVDLNKEGFEKLMAGIYSLTAELDVDGNKVSLTDDFELPEKDLLTTTKNSYGIFVNSQVINKKNEGTIVVSSKTILEKNIISRLFTSFEPEPDAVERDGVGISYIWEREINPGESLEVTVKTNWFLPFFVIVFIVAVVVFVKVYSKKDLVLNKNVSFVRAKGGEFALKVSVFVKARKYVEKVNIIDRLPPLVKIYEKFGREVPSRVNEKAKRIEWNYEKLEQGEVRVLTYFIYSKVGVMGKFALPSATAIYEKKGKIKESNSNRAFFVSAPRGKDDGNI